MGDPQHSDQTERGVGRALFSTLVGLQIASGGGKGACFGAAAVLAAIPQSLYASERTLAQTEASLRCMEKIGLLEERSGRFAPSLSAPLFAPTYWQAWFLVQIMPWALGATGEVFTFAQIPPRCDVAPELDD